MLGLVSGGMGYHASRKAARGISYGTGLRALITMRRAQQAELAADETRQAGPVGRDIRSRQARTQAGAVTAAHAANGLDVGTGTAAKVSNLAIVYGNLEAALIFRNAHRKARNLDITAESLRFQALGELISGNAQASAERTRGTASLIKGVDSSLTSAMSFGFGGGDG